jgi:hypothetical protein
MTQFSKPGSKSLFHSIEARNLRSLQTNSECEESTNPWVYFIYTSSSKTPYRNAVKNQIIWYANQIALSKPNSV